MIAQDLLYAFSPDFSLDIHCIPKETLFTFQLIVINP